MKDTSFISGDIFIIVVFFVYCGVVIIIIPVTIVFEVVMKNLGQLPTESELLRMVREVSSTWVVLADLQRVVIIIIFIIDGQRGERICRIC